MDSNVLALFNNSNFRRLSSIAAIFGCVFCSITQELMCSEPFNTSAQQLAIATVYNVFDVNTDSVTAKFDELECYLQLSENPIHIGCEFLEFFIEELNSTYDLTLTIETACALVRENLQNIKLSEASLDVLYKTILLLESSLMASSEKSESSYVEFHEIVNSLKISLLPKWLDKKVCKSRNNSTKFHRRRVAQIDSFDVELPADIYVGGVEMFAGVLVLTLGLVFTPAIGFGLGMIGDGARRVLDGATELGNQRRLLSQK